MDAQKVTRSILERALNEPMFLLVMAVHGIAPKDIEITVKWILEYLEKAKPEFAKKAEKQTPKALLEEERPRRK